MSQATENPIELAEREIRRDSEDLARLKQRYPGYDFVRVTGSVVAPAIKETRPVLQVAILGIIDTSPEREWTSRSMLAALTEGGQVSFANDTAGMNAVGAALIAMADAGKIIRTHQGRGRDPHRYTSKASRAGHPPAVEES